MAPSKTLNLSHNRQNNEFFEYWSRKNVAGKEKNRGGRKTGLVVTSRF
jgi:hypothetical protein